jgi:hypothetical protein
MPPPSTDRSSLHVEVYRSLLKRPSLRKRAPVIARLEPDLEKGIN